MSTTIKVIYNNEDLVLPDHRDMYIEVDDLVHLHYRDLRLDFGRKEFEDFVGTFRKLTDSLLEIISKTDCKDAPVDDFDGAQYKIWSSSPLKNPAPGRVALVEGNDGYHLKYRNYDLLLDEKAFRTLKNAFSSCDAEMPMASTFDELLALFKLNRVRFSVQNSDTPAGGAHAAHKLVMREDSAAKARAIMAGIGMEGRLRVDKVIYTKNDLVVELVSEEDLAEQR